MYDRVEMPGNRFEGYGHYHDDGADDHDDGGCGDYDHGHSDDDDACDHDDCG